MSRKYVNFDVEDNISKYFKDVRKSIVLTSDEEIKLAKRIKEGDDKAVDALVSANLKFVVSIAKEYQNQGLALSDLISEGNYGLIKAAKKFDHERGFRFISYAVWWIRQSILQSLNDNARMVRLPSNVINKLTYLNREISKFEFLNEREPVYGEILNKDNQAMELLYFPKCFSLNETINDEGDELIELIPDITEEENKIENDIRITTELNKTLSVLDDREREIIENYFGLNTDLEPMTLEAIGEKYGLTKERIRQIKEKTIRKLRHNANGLYSLLNE
jgi:RNA polymerase primary sigma factor|tara:strand:- start:31516 stop:32346 length:831 start_codon:yes stop_codon:yes gene_type:complete